MSSIAQNASRLRAGIWMVAPVWWSVFFESKKNLISVKFLR